MNANKQIAWECFSDPSYFDMWAVKQIHKKGFDDAFHVTSEVEARRLCALLNTLPAAAPAPASTQDEPFGYFRAEPFGWADCAADDEGAIALYERPAAPAVPQGWRKQRMANWPHSEHGMRLIGFVVPDDGRPLGLMSERLEEIIGSVTPATPPAAATAPTCKESLKVAPAPAVPQGLEPAGFLLHWPAPGGSREIIWSDSRISGDAIGCPVTPVFKFSAQSQPVTLTDEPVAYIETITGRLCATHDEHRLKFPMCYAPLYTRPAASPQSQTDEVFEALELDPESFRTEGGAVNASKLKAAILHPYNYLHRDHWLQARFSKPGGRPLATDARKPLTEIEMEKGREQLFSTNNPYCPCDRKTFKKVAEWVERHHGIAALREKEAQP